MPLRDSLAGKRCTMFISWLLIVCCLLLGRWLTVGVWRDLAGSSAPGCGCERHGIRESRETKTMHKLVLPSCVDGGLSRRRQSQHRFLLSRSGLYGRVSAVMQVRDIRRSLNCVSKMYPSCLMDDQTPTRRLALQRSPCRRQYQQCTKMTCTHFKNAKKMYGVQPDG